MIEALREKPNKNVYYLAISAMQKAIRRGQRERALNFAKVAWRIEPYKLFCRLWTVLFEDCGRTEYALRLFYNHRGGSSKFEGLMLLVEAMASGTRCRNVCNLSLIIKGEGIAPMQIHHYIGSTKYAPVLRLFDLHKRLGSDLWSEAYDFDLKLGEDFSWTVELANRSTKFDWEHFGLSLPFFFSKDFYVPENACERIDEITQPSVLYDDFLPLEAVDWHTRPGKAACFAYAKNYSADLSGEEVGQLIFFNEGWCHTKRLVYPFSFAMLYAGNLMPRYGRYLTPAMQSFALKTVLPKLNELRVWALNNIREDVIVLKQLYADQFIPG